MKIGKISEFKCYVFQIIFLLCVPKTRTLNKIHFPLHKWTLSPFLPLQENRIGVPPPPFPTQSKLYQAQRSPLWKGKPGAIALSASNKNSRGRGVAWVARASVQRWIARLRRPRRRRSWSSTSVRIRWSWSCSRSRRTAVCRAFPPAPNPAASDSRSCLTLSGRDSSSGDVSDFSWVISGD